MADVALQSDYISDYLKPGMKAWFKIQKQNERGRMTETIFGSSGDIIYRGYTQFGSAFFMIFDHVNGMGKRATIQTYAVNTFHCAIVAPLEEGT
jgi:hypothetical protein